MSDETTLLPCPFCGGEAFVNDDPTGNGGKPHMSGNVGLGRLWSVECDECGADAGFWQDRNVAIAAWNTRATHGMLTAGQVRELIAPHLHARPTFDFGRHGAVWRADFQAIADELNARAERTCEMYRDKHGTWHCKSCESGADADTGSDGTLDAWCDSWPPNYCPNCGAKVRNE